EKLLEELLNNSQAPVSKIFFEKIYQPKYGQGAQQARSEMTLFLEQLKAYQGDHQEALEGIAKLKAQTQSVKDKTWQEQLVKAEKEIRSWLPAGVETKEKEWSLYINLGAGLFNR